MAIQLSDEQRQYLKSQLKTIIPGATYYIFGSRVKGTAKPASDLDTVIVSDHPVPLATLSKLKEILSESDIPFKIDIVDWHRISDEFRKNIEAEWIEL